MEAAIQIAEVMIKRTSKTWSVVRGETEIVYHEARYRHQIEKSGSCPVCVLTGVR